MIQNLSMKGFTLFKDEAIEFGQGLNVIVGSNGTGKSHLLKLAYTVARWQSEQRPKGEQDQRPDKATLQKTLASKLNRVFRPDQLGRLCSRGQGRARAQVDVEFYPPSTPPHKLNLGNMGFSFASNSSTDVSFDHPPTELQDFSSVFIPTKEMLSMFPGFLSLYEERELNIDETYADLCSSLNAPLTRGPRFEEARKLLEPIEHLLGGSIRSENGKFYLVQIGAGQFEIPLVAEGFRKLGTLAFLIANGTLVRNSMLFWDEPETNLNASFLRNLAQMLVNISHSETQVVVATHSLFLLRELSMLSEGGDARFFALDEHSADLSANWDERSTRISKGRSAEDIEPIAALDAELRQSDRYLELI